MFSERQMSSQVITIRYLGISDVAAKIVARVRVSRLDLVGFCKEFLSCQDEAHLQDIVVRYIHRLMICCLWPV